MNRSNDEVYADWMSKWRLWKNAWCDCDEPIVEFYIQFISKGGKYTSVDHANLAGFLSDHIGTSRIDKTATISINNGSVVLPTIDVCNKLNSKCIQEDRLGVVTLRLRFFTRRGTLKVALILEGLGHGVLHDNGRIVSTSYTNNDDAPRKMPYRDDPIWDIITGQIGQLQ